jgi:hypothetical protein
MTDKRADLKKIAAEAAAAKNGEHSTSGDALLKLVNELYDTKTDKMHQLTKLNRREILPLSLMMTKNEVMNENRKALYDKNGKLIRAHIPISRVWMGYYFGLKRSEDKWAFMIGAGLAHEQALATTEGAEEEFDL